VARNAPRTTLNKKHAPRVPTNSKQHTTSIDQYSVPTARKCAVHCIKTPTSQECQPPWKGTGHRNLVFNVGRRIPNLYERGRPLGIRRGPQGLEIETGFTTVSFHTLPCAPAFTVIPLIPYVPSRHCYTQQRTQQDCCSAGLLPFMEPLRNRGTQDNHTA
jgi:hypothetical protein